MTPLEEERSARSTRGDAMCNKQTLDAAKSVRLSVVIPAYNEEKALGAALESAMGQTFREIEIICVDDCSTDGTVRVAERAAAADTRVRLIRFETNRGILMARRAGTLAAVGDCIMYLDADDTLAPDACEKALKVMETTGAELVHFRANYKASEAFRQTPAVEAMMYKEASGEGAWEGLLPGTQLLERFFITKTLHWSVWSKACTAELAKRVYGMFGEERCDLGEDAMVAFLLLTNAARVAYLPERLYTYHIGVGITAATDVRKARAVATEYRVAQLLEACLTDEQKQLREVACAVEALHGELLDAVMWNLLHSHDETVVTAMLQTLGGYDTQVNFLKELQAYRMRDGQETIDELRISIEREHADWNALERHYNRDIDELKATLESARAAWTDTEAHYNQDLAELKAATEQERAERARVEAHYNRDIDELKATLERARAAWAETETHYAQDIAELKSIYVRDTSELKSISEREHAAWSEAEAHYLRDIAELKDASEQARAAWTENEQKYEQDIETLKRRILTLEGELDYARRTGIIEHLRTKRALAKRERNA